MFDPILFHCRLNPELPALMSPDSRAEELSYADLARRVDAAAHLLARSAIAPSQRIGIHCRQRLLQIVAASALSRMRGATLVFAPGGLFVPGSIDVLITDAPGFEGPTKTILLDAESLMEARVERTGRTVTEGGGKNAQWVFHSRSRRSSIAIDEDVLLARIAQRSRAKAAGGAARWLCAIDICSELGFSAVMECLWTGGTALLSSGTLEEDMLAIRLYEADHLLVGNDLAADYLRTSGKKTDMIAAGLRTAIIAGAPLDEESVDRMRMQVSPNTVLHLDLPETGTFAACSNWQRGTPRRYWPLPGVELRILAHSGESTGSGSSGRVAIKSPAAARATSVDADQFVDGWFRSPLAGSITSDRALVLG